LIDPDRFFNHDHDRDEKFQIKVCWKLFNQSLIEMKKSGFDR